MSRRTSPWQNRPSIIACWEKGLKSDDGLIAPISSTYLYYGNLNAYTQPIPVPRACRLTRIGVRCVNTAATTDPFFVNISIEKSSDCGATFPVGLTYRFSSDPDAAACSCGKSYMQFNACDVWRSYAYFNDSGFASVTVTNFVIRVELHFELR